MARYLVFAVGAHIAVLYGHFFSGVMFCTGTLCMQRPSKAIFRVCISVYDGVGSSYSVWLFAQRMVPIVSVIFASVIVTLLVLWFFLLHSWFCCVRLFFYCGVELYDFKF